MTTRKLLLANASALAIGICLSQPAAAAACLTSGVISVPCSGMVEVGGNLSITSAGTVSGAPTALDVRTPIFSLLNRGQILSPNGIVINSPGSITSLQNFGLISALPTGLNEGRPIDNNGTIASLLNEGTIAASGMGSALAISSDGGVFGTIVNTGLIQAISTQSDAKGIVSWSAPISSLTNSGTISVSGVSANGIKVDGATIGTLTNSGLLAAIASGEADGIYLGGSCDAPCGGTITTLNNSGTISASGATSRAIFVRVGSNLVSLSNAGLITATSTGASDATAILNRSTIGAISNTGTITATNAIYSTGVLGTVANSGLINGHIHSANDLVIVGGLTSGTFSGGTITAPNVIFDSNVLTLSDAINANANGGAGTVTNRGAAITIDTVVAVSGNYKQTDGALQFGANGELVVSGTANVSGGLVGFLPTGNYFAGSNLTIISASTGSSYSGFATGPSGLDATADTTSTKDLVVAIRNTYIGGALSTLTNSGAISGGDDAVYIADSGNLGTFTNNGTLNGNTNAFYNEGLIANITNNGVISGIGTTGTVVGVFNIGTIVSFNNFGQIKASDATIGGHPDVAMAMAVTEGYIETITNHGTISALGAAAMGISAANSETIAVPVIGTLTNTGTISATATIAGAVAIYNSETSSITSLTNSGLIHSESTGVTPGARASSTGINNDGTIGTLTNTGTISATATIAGAVAIYNSDTSSITSLTNSGLIHGEFTGVTPGARASGTGINNAGTIGTLTNTGTISATAAIGQANAIYNFGSLSSTGSIALLNNSGLIDGEYTGADPGNENFGAGIYNESAVIGTLTNSGTIRGSQYAIYSDANVTLRGSLGVIENSGLISGNIKSNQDLVINGGSSTGTLTGGTITVPGVTFASGNQLLADDITAARGTGTVLNSGATLSLSSLVNITGTYNQSSAGSLVFNGGELVVSGNANVAGTVATAATLTGNYFKDDTATLVSANALTYSATFEDNTTGLDVTAATAGNNLIATYHNDYVGGNLASAANDGTIGGVDHALYVAAAGNLGTFTNSGVLNGAIDGVYNAGSINLLTNSGTIQGSQYAIYNTGSLGTITNSGVISGNIFSNGNLNFIGSANSYGGLSNGTISAANVTFGSGNILLADNIAAANVTNAGAVLDLPGSVSISGNFTQSSGATLILGSGSAVAVGGQATIGGTVMRSLSATGNYLVGGSSTLVSANAMAYSGTLIELLPGVNAAAAVVNNNLVETYRNDYVGGSLDTITNAGTISGGAYALYVAETGTLGTITNSGVFEGNVNAVFNAGQISQFVNTGKINAPVAGSHDGQIAEAIGIFNAGRIEIIGNTGSIVAQGNSAAGVFNVAPTTSAISSAGTIGVLSNSGVISAAATSGIGAGIFNMKSLATIANSGLLDGEYSGASAGALAFGAGVYNMGTIGQLVNTGTILGSQYAIYNIGHLGLLTNANLIKGNIASTESLTIAGGDGVEGTFTGGIITAPSVVFRSGQIQLADSITAADVTNNATIGLGSPVSITGNYTQGVGSTLIVGNGGSLHVSGQATIAGDIRDGQTAASNYFADGTSTLVSAGELHFTGSFWNLTTGMNVTAAVVGNSLVATFHNDYIGGNYVAATNAGTISGVDYALYVAAAGNLGTFTNSGVLNGLVDAVYNAGSINLLTNTGAINDGSGINNVGAIVTLTNAGLIGGDDGINNSGSIGAIGNSGTIQGTNHAIYNTGSLGTITNTGLISGGIFSNGALAFVGGTGASFGTLSGGTITATSVAFTSGNIMLADNIVAANVTNTGATLELAQTQSITGNYTQTGGSLRLDATNATSFGSLAVSGSAAINNATITLAGANLSYGQSYLIVDAGAASTYGNNHVNAGPYYVMLSAVGDDLYARLGYAFKDIGAAAGGDAAVMGSLFDTAQSNAAFGGVLTALSGITDKEMATFLTQTAPAQVGGGAAVLQRAMLMTGQIDAAVGSRTAAPRSGHGWSLWGQAVGGFAHRGAEAATEATKTSTTGFALGADGYLDDATLIGGAFSWSEGWTSGKDTMSASNNRVNSVQMTAYGTWSDGPLSVNALAAIGFDSYLQHRAISTLKEVARGDYGGRHYELKADAAYDLPLGDFTFTPGASLKWLNVWTKDYTETGADVLNLTVNGSTQNQLESMLGAKFTTSVGTSIGTLMPELRLGWLHDFEGDDVTTQALLSGIRFSTMAARTSADGLQVGAGLSLLRAGGTSVRLGYDGDYRSGYTAHTAQLEVRIQY